MADYFHATGGTIYKEGGAVSWMPNMRLPLPHSNYTEQTTYDEFDGVSPDASPHGYPTVGSSGDVSFPTSGTGASVTYSAIVARRHLIKGVTVSYNSAPSGGELTVSSSGTVISKNFITDAGPTTVDFGEAGLAGNINEAMTIALTSGGASVTGRLQVLGHQVI